MPGLSMNASSPPVRLQHYQPQWVVSGSALELRIAPMPNLQSRRNEIGLKAPVELGDPSPCYFVFVPKSRMLIVGI